MRATRRNRVIGAVLVVGATATSCASDDTADESAGTRATPTAESTTSSDSTAPDTPTAEDGPAQQARMTGLRRLGFTAHANRRRPSPGCPAMEWSADQTDRFVDRVIAYRRKHQT